MKLGPVFLSLFLMITAAGVHADEPSVQAVRQTADVQSVLATDLNSKQAPCGGILSEHPANYGRLPDARGKEFPVSIVSPEKVAELFRKMAEQPHIPFKYPEDGCYARAHEMSRLLEQMGISTGKVFIEGSLRVETPNSPKGYVEWWYHVAPVMLVREKDGSVRTYVIDPSIFDHAVPVEEWYDIQAADKKGRKTYHTRRYNYYPSDKNTELMDYKKSDLEDMKQTMERYMKIQEERAKKKDGN